MEEQAARPTARGRRRAWWLPTVGVFTAFFAGLWLGGTLSFTETVSAGALIAGAVGTGAGLARLVRQDLIRRRQRQAELDRQRAQEERERLLRERVL